MAGWKIPLLALALACPTGSAHAVSTYSVRDVGALPGVSTGFARAISDGRAVTGESGDSAFLWKDGLISALPSPPGVTSAIGWAINVHTDVGGGGSFQPLYWRGGTFVPIAPIAGMALTPTGINRYGDITGLSLANVGARQRAFILTASTITLLPEPSGASASWAWAISDSGFIAGGDNATGLRWSNLGGDPLFPTCRRSRSR